VIVLSLEFPELLKSIFPLTVVRSLTEIRKFPAGAVMNPETAIDIGEFAPAFL